MSILEIIKNRRSIDPDHFNGEMISREIIEQMLEAANWAPYTWLYRTLAFCNF
jgi:nitroreductase